MGLRCRIPGCRAEIRALTGLQEVAKLQRHLNRVHRAPDQAPYTLHDALVFRQRFERQHDEARSKGDG